MEVILKKELCEKLTGKTVVSIVADVDFPDCPNNWCEQLTIELDTGEKITINAGSIRGEAYLFFES